MAEISRRGLLGLALAGLAGCKCVSTDKTMDLPLLGNVRPYPVPIIYSVKLSRDKNHCQYPCDKNVFFMDDNGVVFVRTKDGHKVAVPMYKGKHDYKSFFDSVRNDFKNHTGKFYEIVNMDTGEGGLLYV